MTPQRALILRTTGTNCEVETEQAFRTGGYECQVLHLNRITEAPVRLREFEVIVIPGGFSYGDDIGSGVVLAHQIKRFLKPELARFLDRGGRMLGICNGFQALLRAGLLTADDGHFEDKPSATLTWNASGRYEDRWVRLVFQSGKSAWIPMDFRMACPVRHAEGRFVTRDQSVYARLEESGQIAVRYAGDDWNPSSEYPANPNGSQDAVAGITSKNGLILGMMPHPECALEAHHFPGWTREAPETFPARMLFQAPGLALL